MQLAFRKKKPINTRLPMDIIGRLGMPAINKITKNLMTQIDS